MKYDEAINFANEFIIKNNLNKEIVGIDISTRPDCITEDICKLISTYRKNYYVNVELGLQTSNDETGKFINRCYTSNDFTNSVSLLTKYGIDVTAHIMIGLPYETHKDIENTVTFLNSHQLQGIKIHSTYIVKKTMLATLYENKKYSPITLEEYLKETTYVITHINPNFVIHRISGDAPKDLLIAPEWNLHKKLVLNGIFNKFENEDLWQGMYY